MPSRRVVLKRTGGGTQQAGLARSQAQRRLLTPRERQIVGLVATGASNKEIAQQLAIAEKTVKAHLTSVFEKVGCSSRLQLAIYAISNRLAG